MWSLAALPTARATKAGCWQARQNLSSSHFQVGTAATGLFQPRSFGRFVADVRFGGVEYVRVDPSLDDTEIRFRT